MKTRQMRTLLAWTLFGASSLAGLGRARAEDASGPSTETAGTNAVVTLTRDPFWPIGWEPPRLGRMTTNAPVKDVLTKWDKARAILQVTGLSKSPDGKYLAILKGIGVVEEGDTVSVNYMGLNYKWKITSVTSKGIVPERIGVFPIK